VTVAHQALPFAHIKKKAATSTKVTYGASQTVVNERLGPRVKVVKVKSDQVDEDPYGFDPEILESLSQHADADSITPLDFLLGVMRNVKSPASLRLRVAKMVVPYVHPRGEPGQLEETRAH
jgi:hypothetical protein